MDGTLIASERVWPTHADEVGTIFEPEIWEQISHEFQPGVHIGHYLKCAQKLGAAVNKKEYYDHFYAIGDKVYEESPLTEGVQELYIYLRSQGYKVGMISSAPLRWMQVVADRLGWRDDLDLLLSVDDHPILPPKPDPAGYIWGMQELGGDPDHTIVLEDSNPGIASAKASGAITIGFTPHLPEGYIQEGADMYLDSIPEVLQWVQFVDEQDGMDFPR